MLINSLVWNVRMKFVKAFGPKSHFYQMGGRKFSHLFVLILFCTVPFS